MLEYRGVGLRRLGDTWSFHRKVVRVAASSKMAVEDGMVGAPAVKKGWRDLHTGLHIQVPGRERGCCGLFPWSGWRERGSLAGWV